ncbi:MAG TPA: FAD-dependent oxidoreductase [Polyangiaceae bacterium]|jgi:hypothetical protein
MAFIDEPARQTTVIARAQVVVLGGGPSGIAAAVSAARAGATVALVERYGFLGGMGTAAMVTSFCGLHANVHGEIQRVVHGLADEIVDRLSSLGGLNRTHSVLGRTVAQSYDVGAYKCVADDLVVGSGVDLHLHAFAAGVRMSERTIEALFIETKSGRGAIVGDVFIDCSGDADLAAWAGAPYEKGDLAFPTLMFRLGNVDDAVALAEGKPKLRALIEAEEKESGEPFPRRAAYVNPQAHAREWRVNATQIARDGRAVDGTSHDDLRHGEVDGRRQIRRFHDFLRRRVPGFSDSYLLEIAPQLGIRETRRVVGAYVLTGDDVLACRDFPDAIGVNGWPVEEHVRGDVVWRWPAERGYHQIPFRCLVPRDVTNLLVAGRCASATHEGQASLRVSGPCFAMGQAAGTAAALSAQSRTAISQINISQLQERLRAAGAFLGDPK